jgi:hypothetical protein
LSARLHRFVTEIEPIKLPSRERWEGLMVRASLKLPFDYSYFWALHFYRAPENFRKRVEEFNAAVMQSGLPQLARGEDPDPTSPAAIIRRGIGGAKVSTAFINSGFHLGMLRGRLYELRESNEEFASLLKAGAAGAVIGQRVWYARWLVANANTLEHDRQDKEFELADLCEDIVFGRRKLPAVWIWKAGWFEKLLPKKKESSKPGGKFGTVVDERDAGLLASRFTRLSNETIRKLAAHRYVTADLLPPLVVGEFPPGSISHP